MKFLLLIFNLLVPVSNFTERICFAPDGWRIEFVLWKSYYQYSTYSFLYQSLLKEYPFLPLVAELNLYYENLIINQTP